MNPSLGLYSSLGAGVPSCKPTSLKSSHLRFPEVVQRAGWESSCNCAGLGGLGGLGGWECVCESIRTPPTVLTARGRVLVRSSWVMTGLSYIGLSNAHQWNKSRLDVSSSPRHKSCKQPQPFGNGMALCDLRMEFKSFLLRSHSHSHGNSRWEWFCCHYCQALTLDLMNWCCPSPRTSERSEHQPCGMHSQNCPLTKSQDTLRKSVCVCVHAKYIYMYMYVYTYVYVYI